MTFLHFYFLYCHFAVTAKIISKYSIFVLLPKLLQQNILFPDEQASIPQRSTEQLMNSRIARSIRSVCQWSYHPISLQLLTETMNTRHMTRVALRIQCPTLSPLHFSATMYCQCVVTATMSSPKQLIHPILREEKACSESSMVDGAFPSTI